MCTKFIYWNINKVTDGIMMRAVRRRMFQSFEVNNAVRKHILVFLSVLVSRFNFSVLIRLFIAG